MGKPIRNHLLGTREWYNERWWMLHRMDGPALEYDDGRKSWWLHGVWKASQRPTEDSLSDHERIGRFYERDEQ